MSADSSKQDHSAEACDRHISSAISALVQQDLETGYSIAERNRTMHGALRRLQLLPNILELQRIGSRPEWDNYTHRPTPAEVRALRVQQIVQPHSPFLGMVQRPQDVEAIVSELQRLQWNALNPEAESDEDWYAAQHDHDSGKSAD
ncbi:hypothetical protein COU78_01725 [Candidatus Peregrinibacteria bacterium CG10_big_fil_rev_8_21_14_0_10_49_24]|nr:MAG: hypothetical protein COV83_00360 [Candidatus Peregrinibacteria bacterium CG11_big_fil_rev_8_21_14_0_20_49_14]PIR51441.1 MAG: hypothetical protein COU78_01725 [Candidatus Peregrinibacteria bacterium CG10_big_fil_rev_8_21_14_0_10_49_24]PJA67377.1 MAG: hypothetical protein CO157_04955 [Candidatus Peregrinibacteria bacterium CG_4_9_14_3_um_filter_49_12]